MPRLIDADALPVYRVKILHAFGIIEGNVIFPEHIENAPTIDAEPVRHGRWIYKPDGWYCSACDKRAMVDAVGFAKYCCRCGAKMDGGAEDA